MANVVFLCSHFHQFIPVLIPTQNGTKVVLPLPMKFPAGPTGIPNVGSSLVWSTQPGVVTSLLTARQVNKCRQTRSNCSYNSLYADRTPPDHRSRLNCPADVSNKLVAKFVKRAD